MTAQPATDRLAALPGLYAQPDPSTLATLPKGGANLLYMGHAEVTLALIAADPLWTWEPLAIDTENGRPMIDVQGKRLAMWGYLTICGHRRLCVGTCDAGKGDPEKELIGDLLRNGAMRFGIGTKLWSKAVDADPAGSGSSGFSGRRPAPRSASRAELEPEHQAPPPAYSAAAMALYDRVAAVRGTPKADALKKLANENNRNLNAGAFDADPTWAELVAAELAPKGDQANTGEMFGGAA